MSVPSADAGLAEALDLLASRRYVVLTGAGISTDSGIPDYRGPRPVGAAPVRMPMTYQEFVASPENRQRYWARAHLGWSRMGSARPNAGHHALATLDPDLVVTQNVDGLHERAGQRSLVALHGRISDVVCLDCRQVTSRVAVQEAMTEANPGWIERHRGVAARPDGDVLLEQTAGFVVPSCTQCGGPLKPDVVFFGENVPKQRVLRCQQAVESAEALLVVGSSLTVMSGFRFVRQAHRAGRPVVIVNRGQTRGDALATVKLELGCSEFLEALRPARASVTAAG
ncbi:NAD-dependent protein deacetylase [Nocardioides terrisoli]|uniref:NAD-dependent protein deacetylase n=1 Tax=Nocardioides terrisoli TaxID=3388267 RepID=UPI00287B69C3|nr:NAD-dependent protein deacetylase [Nocardioides marmorisolisilvae]